MKMMKKKKIKQNNNKKWRKWRIKARITENTNQKPCYLFSKVFDKMNKK